MANKSFELGGSDFDWLLVLWLCELIHQDVETVKKNKQLYQCIVKKAEELKSNFNMEGVDEVDIELEHVSDDSSDEEDDENIFRFEYEDFCTRVQSVIDKFHEEITPFIMNLPPLSRCEITGSGSRNRQLRKVLLETVQVRNPEIISFVVASVASVTSVASVASVVVIIVAI